MVREFCAAFMVAAPPVTHWVGPVLPQAAATAQATGSGGPAAFAPVQATEAHSATAAVCASNFCLRRSFFCWWRGFISRLSIPCGGIVTDTALKPGYGYVAACN